MKRLRLPRHTLFWKFYFYGLLLLLAVAVAGGTVALLVGKTPSWPGGPERVVKAVVGWCESHPDRPAELGTRLAELSLLLQMDLAVYDEQGRLVAAGGTRPPRWSALDEPTPPPHLSMIRERHVQTLILAGERRLTLVLEWDAYDGLHRHLLSVALVFLLLLLMPYVFARTFIRPLNRLAEAAKFFGAGDLKARAALKRCDEIGQVARAFDDMADRVAVHVRSEKELLANLSHEVRTPLARIRVATEICNDAGVDADTIRTHLAGIEKDLVELEHIVNQVLTITRLDLAMDSGAPSVSSLERLPVDLAALASGAAERFREANPDMPLQLLVAEGLPRPLGDARFLRRVADNLLDNAAKYAPAGSPVELAVEFAPEGVAVAVRDCGEAIPEEERERIFEPFYRRASLRADGPGGVGLGLALCRRVLDVHGGAIRCRPRPGGGNEFRFVLPR